MLNFLYKYHDDWLRIADSFLNNKEDSEDIVQNMYLRLHKYNVKLEDIKYKDDVNRYFIYTTLRNMCFLFLKMKREKPVINIDDVSVYYKNYNKKNEGKECFDNLFDLVNSEVETWSYYDRTLFEVYMYSGLSFRDMAYGSIKKPKLISNTKALNIQSVIDGNGISVSSMFNTIKKCKAKLKEKFGEDFEDYFNNDYDKI